MVEALIRVALVEKRLVSVAPTALRLVVDALMIVAREMVVVARVVVPVNVLSPAKV